MYIYAFWILPNCYLIGKIAHFNSKIEHSQKSNWRPYRRRFFDALYVMFIDNKIPYPGRPGTQQVDIH